MAAFNHDFNLTTDLHVTPYLVSASRRIKANTAQDDMVMLFAGIGRLF